LPRKHIIENRKPVFEKVQRIYKKVLGDKSLHFFEKRTQCSNTDILDKRRRIKRGNK
jgi:hypothetical protein